MKNLKPEDFAPLSGVVTVVLLAVTVILFNAYDYFPTPARTAEIFRLAADRAFFIALFGMLAGLALVWFSGSLFSSLKQHESGSGRLAITAMAGGVVSGAGLIGAYGVVYFAAGQAGRPGGIDLSEAWVMYSLYSALMGLLHGLVLMIGAAGLVALRTRAFPSRFGWVSVVVALGLVTPLDYIFEGIALVWIVAVSVWFFVREAREIPSSTTGV